MRRFLRDGIWRKSHDRFRACVRSQAYKKPIPGVRIPNSQSVKTVEEREGGYNAGKAITGRKRNVLFNTLGLREARVLFVRFAIVARFLMSVLPSLCCKPEVLFAREPGSRRIIETDEEENSEHAFATISGGVR